MVSGTMICKTHDCIFNREDTAECQTTPTIGKVLEWHPVIGDTNWSEPKCLSYKRKART